MSEKCPVCEHTVADGATKCDNCGFEDALSIDRVWPNPEDGNRWMETTVKPYRALWKDKEELLKNAKMPTTPPIPKPSSTSSAVPKAEKSPRRGNMIPLAVLAVVCVIAASAFFVLTRKPSAKVHFDRGVAHYNKKDYEKAAADFEAALRIDPDHDAAKSSLESTRQAMAAATAQDSDNSAADAADATDVANAVDAAPVLKTTAPLPEPERPQQATASPATAPQPKSTSSSVTEATPPPAPPPSVAKGTLIDYRDAKTYKTVKVGTQTWMAENLNYDLDNSRCYGNNPANCGKYGRLYDWNTAKRACLDGWHLPSKLEWEKLVQFAGGSGTAGKKLKSARGWNGNGSGTDEFGFSAMPSGHHDAGGRFGSAGDGGYWWSASESGSSNASYWNMHYGSDRMGDGSSDKGDGFSVRCVMGGIGSNVATATGTTAPLSAAPPQATSSSTNDVTPPQPAPTPSPKRSEDQDAAYNRATLVEARSPDEAIAIFVENTNTYPRDYRNFLKAGVYYARKNNPRRALPMFEKCVAIVDTISRAWYELGMMYGAQRRDKDMLMAFQKFITIESKNTEAISRVGEYLLVNRNMPTDALMFLEMANALKPNTHKYVSLLAQAYMRTGRNDEGLKLQERAKKLEGSK